MELTTVVVDEQAQTKPQCPICASPLMKRYADKQSAAQINYQPHETLFRSYCRRCGYGS